MLENIKLIQLPKFSDSRGHLTFLENNFHIPFAIKRVYYLYDVPSDGDRGGHAHKQLHQLILPISGSFDITLHDGYNARTYHLKNPWEGVYICPRIWRTLSNFSSGSVCMVFASEFYDPEDYIRNYNDFIKYVTS